jgi:rhodanese-related sulfurtransferase
MLPREITVDEFAAWRADAHRPQPLLLDVRHGWEFDLARLPESTLLPLPELEERLDELTPFKGTPVVCLCHHGVRSLNASQYLKLLGFDATSVQGGIDAWSLVVDPRVPRY